MPAAPRGQRDDGGPQGFGAPGVRLGVRVPEADVDGHAEGQGDEHDQGDGGPGAAAADGGLLLGQSADGAGVLTHPFLRRVLLHPGSPDERFVEDERAVFVLAARGVLGRAVRRF
jgi:hypothetical protein